MRFGAAQNGAVYELSREDGHVIPAWEENRRRDGIIDTNRLSADEAVRLSRSIRAKALKPLLPDSTPFIRAERDRQ